MVLVGYLPNHALIFRWPRTPRDRDASENGFFFNTIDTFKGRVSSTAGEDTARWCGGA
jgi:hypothetical protein